MATKGTVYLIHFSSPFRHARHYMGWTENLGRRIDEHQSGRGARLMEVVVSAGISFQVSRTWSGSRKLERKLKNMKCAPKLCPCCNPRMNETR